MHFRKLMNILLIICIFTLLCGAKKTDSDEDNDSINNLSSLTGLSKSEIVRYGAKLEDILMAYAIYSYTGNSIKTILEVSDGGKDFKKFYAQYNITKTVQSNINSKYNTLRVKVFKEKFTPTKYDGINKKEVASKISQKTGVSESSVVEYGFRSGLNVNDILFACEIASKTGNSLSSIIDVRKGGGNWDAVYERYNISPAVQGEISSKYNEDQQYIQTVGQSKKEKKYITDEMKKNAEIISNTTGIYKGKILDYYKEGDSEEDIIRGCAIAWRTGNDIYNIMRLKEEGRWNRVYNSYNISPALKGEIDSRISEINSKLKPDN